MVIDFKIHHNLELLNRTLEEYIVASRLSADEVLEKKGRDLNIKLFQGFWAYRFKATKAQRRKGALFAGPAFEEAKARGWRVKVREGMKLNGDYRMARAKTTGRKNKRAGLNNRALLVAQELATRQRGSGVLGVSFLQWRWRKGQKTIKGRTGKYLVRNRSAKLGIMSSVEKWSSGDDHRMKFTNYMPAVGILERRNSIFEKALSAVRADTMVYLERKNKERAERALSKIK